MQFNCSVNARVDPQLWWRGRDGAAWRHILLLLLLLLLCHMPSGTRAKLPCEAKRSSKVNIISIIIVMSVLSINQFNSNQSGQVLEWGH